MSINDNEVIIFKTIVLLRALQKPEAVQMEGNIDGKGLRKKKCSWHRRYSGAQNIEASTKIVAKLR